MSGVPLRARLPLLALGAAGLVWGVTVGLQRMGALPLITPHALMDHGVLMTTGFLGTVISLERAVAFARRPAFLGPLLCGAAVVLMILGARAAASVAALGGSAVVVAVLAVVTSRDRALHHVALLAAALAWLCGNALIVAQRPVFDAVPWWMVFLIGTICAERLELNRLLPRTAFTVWTFAAAGTLAVAGAVATLAARDGGMRLLGAGELGLFLWLWRNDVARRTVRQGGAVRFIAVCLLSGFGWLGVGGALALARGNPLAGPAYDALLHSIFVGFVFAMIFGHAMVIIPAVMGVRIEFRRRFYVHLALLHASLALRVAGDLLGPTPLRQLGGWTNAAAILLFVLSTAAAVRRQRQAAPGALSVAAQTCSSSAATSLRQAPPQASRPCAARAPSSPGPIDRPRAGTRTRPSACWECRPRSS
jgi:hypothetical protein